MLGQFCKIKSASIPHTHFSFLSLLRFDHFFSSVTSSFPSLFLFRHFFFYVTALACACTASVCLPASPIHSFTESMNYFHSITMQLSNLGLSINQISFSASLYIPTLSLNGAQNERRYILHRMNEEYKAWGTLKSLLYNKGLGINEIKCLYDAVIVPMALYAAETGSIRSAEVRRLNVLEVKCSRSLVGVTQFFSYE